MSTNIDAKYNGRNWTRYKDATASLTSLAAAIKIGGIIDFSNDPVLGILLTALSLTVIHRF